MTILKEFRGEDFSLTVFEDGFIFQAIDNTKVGCASIIGEYEHWEEEEEEPITPQELHAMMMAGFFGEVK